LALDVDEYERKSNNMLLATEVRLHGEVVSDRDETTKKFIAIQLRMTSETERIQNDIIRREMESASKSRHQFEDVLKKIEDSKRSLFDEIDRKCSRMQENAAEDSNALKFKFMNKIDSLDSALDRIQMDQSNLTFLGRNHHYCDCTCMYLLLKRVL
jgi:hypothetical protein